MVLRFVIKESFCHCVSNCRTGYRLPEKTSLVLWKFILFAAIVYSLFTATLHIQTFNHAVKSPWLLFMLTAEPLAAIVLLIPPQEILKEFSVSANKGIACLLWKKKHPFNNDWNWAKSFDPPDHFTLLTLPLCSLTWLQLLIMYSI